MKIMYLTDQVFNHGGIEKVLSQKANWFAEVNGDEVWIVTSRQQNKKPVYKFSSEIKWRDLGVNYEIASSYFGKVNLNKIPLHFKKLKQAIREIRPDVIISCNFAPDYYFLPYIVPGIPKVKEYHSSRALQPADNSFFGKITRFTEKKYSAIAVLNKDEKKFYQNNKVVVIPNPAEISVHRSDFSAKKILAAGRISPVKNFSELLEIFGKVAEDFPDWELHIYGEDYLDTEKKLAEQVSKLGLADRIIFKGVTSDLRSTMGEYSIYAMTSETECFPMVLLEALSCGLPIISYDCPTGPANIITDGSDGILIPNKNMNRFAEKLKTLMSDQSLRSALGSLGTQNVERFEIGRVMETWKHLIRELQTGQLSAQ